MIYFDNAATGFPKSQTVFDAMKDAFFCSGNAGRSGHNLAVAGSVILYNCRKAASDMFGCEPEQVVLTKNATEALNLAIKGIYISPKKKSRGKSEVLISSLEHNSVFRPSYALCKEKGLILKQFEVDLYDDANTVSNFSKALSSRTLFAVFTHASNVCGRILPIKELISIAKQKEIPVIIDASQTAGHFPITFSEYDADIICMPGHKGLYGPMGTGLLLVNPKSNICFKTIMEGGSGISSLEKEMPEVLPERLEYGTQNNCGFAGLTAAINELKYPEHITPLFIDFVKAMKQKTNIELYGEPKDNYYSFLPVLLFNKKGIDCEDFAARLNNKGIAVRAGFHCSPLAHTSLGTIKKGGVRISLGRANTSDEIEYFLSVLELL